MGQENPNEPLESTNQNQLNQESLSNPNSSIENSPTQTKTEPVDDESARRNQGKIWGLNPKNQDTKKLEFLSDTFPGFQGFRIFRIYF